MSKIFNRNFGKKFEKDGKTWVVVKKLPRKFRLAIDKSDKSKSPVVHVVKLPPKKEYTETERLMEIAERHGW